MKTGTKIILLILFVLIADQSLKFWVKTTMIVNLASVQICRESKPDLEIHKDPLIEPEPAVSKFTKLLSYAVYFHNSGVDCVPLNT